MVFSEISLTPSERQFFALLRELSSGKKPIYIVGGFIRDGIISPQKKRSDIDIVLKNPERVIDRIAAILKAPCIALDGERGIYRVMGGPFQVDVARMQGCNIEQDLARRDFTINAIAYDVASDAIIDLFDGIRDANMKRLAPVREKNFYDDPLRCLRAYSIGAAYSLRWARGLPAIILRHFGRIKNVAAERINLELARLFGADAAADYVMKMADDGVFDILFPEAVPMKGMYQGPYHHLDVLSHSIAALKEIERIIRGFPKVSVVKNKGIIIDMLKRRMGVWPMASLLKWAALFHDIGKPASRREVGEKVVFYGHQRMGAKIVSKMMRRLKFSNEQVNFVRWLVDEHLLPGNINKSQSEKAVYRLVRRSGDLLPPLCLLSWADAKATRGPLNPWRNFYGHRRFIVRLLNLYISIKLSNIPERLLTGNDIMDLVGLPPSREVGMLLDALKEAQLGGVVKDRQGAIEFVKGLASKKGLSNGG